MNDPNSEQLAFIMSLCPSITIERAKACWRASGGDEILLIQYVLEELPLPDAYQVFPNQGYMQAEVDNELFSTQKQVQQAMKISLEQGSQYQRPNRKRDRGRPVGLVNAGNNCSLSVLLQLLLSQYRILALLFDCRVQNNADKYEKFIKQLQFLYVELILSNKEFCNPKNTLMSLCWTNEENMYVGSQMDIVEIFQLFLSKFDSSVRRLNPDCLQQTTLNNKECFGSKVLNELFQVSVINNGQLEHTSVLMAGLQYKSVYGFMNAEYKNKIKSLPLNLVIQIVRVQHSLGCLEKSKEDFVINKEIALDFTLQQLPQVSQVIDQYSASIKQNGALESIKNQLQALDMVIKMYDAEGIQIDLPKILKSKQQTLQQQLKIQENQIRECSKQVENQLQNMSFKYQLHSVVIHLGNAFDGHNFVYIYNFYLQKWYKYNDTTVSQVLEEEVMKNALNNAQLVTYVSKEQVDLLRYHSQSLDQLSNAVIDQPYQNYRQLNPLCQKIPQLEYNQVIDQNRNQMF